MVCEMEGPCFIFVMATLNNLQGSLLLVVGWLTRRGKAIIT